MSRTETPAFDFRQAMAKGVTWSVLAQASSRLLQFGVTVVLARMLLPEHFGLAGMALMVTGLLSVVCELGLRTAVVQKEDVEESELSAALIGVNAAGLILGTACYAAAGVIATFFREPQVAPVLRLMSLTMPLWALGVIPSALLVRVMRFDRLGVSEVAGSAAYGAVAVAVAAFGGDVWALAAGNIALAFSKSVVAWALCSWVPRVRPDFRRAAGMFAYGGKVLGANAFGYFRQNIDYLIIGRFMGAAPLGIYTIAFKIAEFPKKNLTSIVNSVALPAFAKLQQARDDLRHAYLKTMRLLTIYIAPLLIGAAVLAEPFVLTVYGPKWAAAILPLRLLVVMGILLAMSDLGVALALASGDAGGQFRYSATYALIVALLALAAVPLGINGVAAAVLVGTAWFFLMVQRRVIRILDLGWRRLAEALRPAVIGSLALAAADLLVLWALRESSEPTQLIVGVAAGGAAYLLALRLIGVDEVWRTLVRGKELVWTDVKAKVAARSIARRLSEDT